MSAESRGPLDDPTATAVDPVAFRGVAGRFATGVTVVTTVVGDDHHAMTANSFTSVSLDPVLVLVSVDRSSRFHDVVVRAGVFGVTVLAQDQEEAARWFATRARPHDISQFDPHPHRRGELTGAVLLDGALATLECKAYALHEAGDHSLLLGEVVGMALPRPDAEPLVFYAGRYHRLSLEEK
ncbi:MAG TPA: flavin reductase family protein [Mycobacteriales bacterium]|nr:flavin reductase family protein [Mycobacteriales bacterium]